MPPLDSRWTDRRVEAIVGDILRTGVITAAAVSLVGGVAYLIRYGRDLPQYRVFQGEPDDLRSVHGIVMDAFSLSRRGLIQFGILLLLATPLARVAFSAIAFALQGDRTYVIITLLVLASLLFSLSNLSI
ncbi:MAG TPA: DUF1634 domain-containing protein [Terriglobia bacterium]|nr:DUF1634 domain-containing protein [Terriglobia bacterium]